MMDITATDLVTVRRDDLLAMESEIKGLKAYADRLAAGLPDGMLPKDVENLRAANAGLAQEVQELRETADALAQAYNTLQAENDALQNRNAAGIEYASRFGRIDQQLMIEKLGGTVEPREDAPMQVQCRQCHALYARRVDDKRGRPKFTVQANPLGVVDVIKTPHGFAVCCPECGAERALY